MNAKKCDRCGAYYDVQTLSAFEEAANSLKKMTIFDNDDIENDIIARFDLCCNCKKSLKNWLHFMDTEKPEDADNG